MLKKVTHLLRCKISRSSPLVAGAIVMLSGVMSCAAANQQQTSTAPSSPIRQLDRVKQRGQLICGTSGKVPGFSFVDPQGQYSGLDVDICRAVAVAVLNDSNKVEFRQLGATQRFTSIQTGSIDVISQMVTVTISRQAAVGVAFGPIVLYDGQGIMVKQRSGITDLASLSGKSICVQTGSTTELNLADQFRKRNIPYQPVVFESRDATFTAYEQGRCDAVTTDRSGLVAQRSKLANPTEHVIFADVLSKEPLAPGVKGGDHQWHSILTWTVNALIQAEEYGITSQNVDQIAASSQDPDVRRFLGVEGNIGDGLGLSHDFARRVIKQVGNYAEIYDRNLGADSPLQIERGPNQLWTKGGLLYSPPFR
ncbi:MAG: amino acid ABC transporter substrate-binding protein [Synechococcales cyanobacterium C42_A2020_086]|jgi:general L-amino acid transport system substrate-binding protein|nr:amino acid ABC transporter substrate-binding protein [Synechococcales cyanobacterium C42_A2020_086]